MTRSLRKMNLEEKKIILAQFERFQFVVDWLHYAVGLGEAQ